MSYNAAFLYLEKRNEITEKFYVMNLRKKRNFYFFLLHAKVNVI